MRVSFGTLPDQVSAGTHSGTTISITDDDVPAVTVSFEQDSYSVAEGNSVMVKVVSERRPGAHRDRSQSPSTGQGGATAADYSVPGTVVFNSGDTEKTLSFSATQDSVDDDGESVKLGFGASLPTGVNVGSTDETTVSITDDDVPSVSVSFEQDSYTVGRATASPSR